MNAINTPPDQSVDGVAELSELVTAVKAWRPDRRCLRAGDMYVRRAIRYYAGGLSDLKMRRRLELFAASVADEPAARPRAAALAFAEHCAIVGMSPKRTVQILAHLSVRIPGWEPTDPNEIAALVRDIYRRTG